MGKPLMKNIIVHLNCHTHPIASALSDFFPPSDYNIVKVINFKKQPIPESVLKNCYLYIYQCLAGEHWGQYASDFFKKQLPGQCIVIRYPILRFNPFWPFNTKNAFRTNSNEMKKSALFPDGDNFLISKRNEYNNAEELANEYLNLDLNSLINLDEEFQKILDWYDSPRNSKDINVKDFVLQHFKDRILFHTVDHISDFFLNYMVNNVFRLLGINKTKNYTCKFMEQNNVPMHPSVIKHFNLSFVNEKQLYLYNGNHLTTREYYIKYILELHRLDS